VFVIYIYYPLRRLRPSATIVVALDASMLHHIHLSPCSGSIHLLSSLYFSSLIDDNNLLTYLPLCFYSQRSIDVKFAGTIAPTQLAKVQYVQHEELNPEKVVNQRSLTHVVVLPTCHHHLLPPLRLVSISIKLHLVLKEPTARSEIEIFAPSYT